MVTADEHRGLAVPNLAVVQVGRAGDDEQLVAIDIDLGHLVGLQGVLDRQGVQVKALLQHVELFGCRLIEANPGELAVLEFQ